MKIRVINEPTKGVIKTGLTTQFSIAEYVWTVNKIHEITMNTDNGKAALGDVLLIIRMNRSRILSTINNRNGIVEALEILSVI